MDFPVEDISDTPMFSDKIDRMEWSELSPERYQRDYVLPLKPVIITGGLDHWAARDKWTFDYFQNQHGDMPLEIEGRRLSMAELIAEVRTSSPQSPAPYLHNYPVKNLPKELQDDIEPMPACTAPNWLDHPLITVRAPYLTYKELYIGGQGAKFPVMHYDGLHTHAFLMQIQGVKEYIGFAPDQGKYLYVRNGGNGQPNLSDVNDVDKYDPARFPEFRNAKGIRFKLHPGETLFMPSGWWHTARILSPSITVSINGANAANWGNFRRDFCRYNMPGRKFLPWALNGYLMFVGNWLSMLPPI